MLITNSTDSTDLSWKSGYKWPNNRKIVSQGGIKLFTKWEDIYLVPKFVILTENICFDRKFFEIIDLFNCARNTLSRYLTVV